MVRYKVTAERVLGLAALLAWEQLGMGCGICYLMALSFPFEKVVELASGLSAKLSSACGSSTC